MFHILDTVNKSVLAVLETLIKFNVMNSRTFNVFNGVRVSRHTESWWHPPLQPQRVASRNTKLWGLDMHVSVSWLLPIHTSWHWLVFLWVRPGWILQIRTRGTRGQSVLCIQRGPKLVRSANVYQQRLARPSILEQHRWWWQVDITPIDVPIDVSRMWLTSSFRHLSFVLSLVLRHVPGLWLTWMLERWQAMWLTWLSSIQEEHSTTGLMKSETGCLSQVYNVTRHWLSLQRRHSGRHVLPVHFSMPLTNRVHWQIPKGGGGEWAN